MHSIADILTRVDNSKDLILKQVRDTELRLGQRLGKVESGLAGIQATVKGQGREIGDVKGQVRDHLNKTPLPLSAPVDPAPEASPLGKGKSPRDFIRFYAGLGGLLVGGVLAFLSFLGIL